MVDLLECTVMPYAWGSRTAIAELTGRPAPAPGPEAELWMGAHPSAPSRLVRGGASYGLAEVIAERPSRELGAEIATAYGPHLPFLLKVLAAAEPLSLQAHPDATRAAAGFAEEDRRGIPRDAPTRSYRDTSHKPELLCALRPVDALCGFRRAADTLRLFDELRVKELEPVLAPLRSSPDREGLAAVFRTLMTLPAAEASHLVRATALASASRGPSTSFARENAWAVRLDALYPGDVGVVSALLLNLVHLDIGQALYLGAGNLHAYLDGVGVEIMASSDNVLRGGLTKKHVDVPELMRVLDFSDGPVSPIDPRRVDEHERVWETPAREFRLSAIDLGAGDAVVRDVRGPEILLCTHGAATIVPGDGSAEALLTRGNAAFVPGTTGQYTLRVENAAPTRVSLYRATVNLT
jgi:mannose-6-phosphate isomerase